MDLANFFVLRHSLNPLKFYKPLMDCVNLS